MTVWCHGVAIGCGGEVENGLREKAFCDSKVIYFVLHILQGYFVWSKVFHPEAFAVSLRERGQPHM
jgi:hypothetical protein